MIICIRFGGMEHCFVVPIFRWPWWPPVPVPGPVNYPQLLHDATILNAIRETFADIGDANVRAALEGGFAEAVRAMQAHAGEHVTVRVGEAKARSGR